MCALVLTLQITASPYTVDYAVEGAKHTITISTAGELPDDLFLRVSDEVIAAQPKTSPEATIVTPCEGVGLQKTLKFSELTFVPKDGKHVATLTVRPEPQTC